MKKAYKVWIEQGEGSTIVFAETRNKAKVIALSCDCCEDAEYIDVCVHRMKELDHLYKSRSEIDWWDPETRIILVRDFGWSCYEAFISECEYCPAKQFCERFQELEGEPDAK